jgi:hypothetical protein
MTALRINRRATSVSVAIEKETNRSNRRRTSVELSHPGALQAYQVREYV